MPIEKHYGGHGEEVMADMKARYGEEKGERVFYATEKKRLDGDIGKTIKRMRDKHRISKRLAK